MKNFLAVCLLVLVSSCSNTEESDYKFSTNSIVVYGNLHLVESNILSNEALNEQLPTVVATQRWLYDTVSEDIVLIEGFPCDSQFTLEHYKNYFKEKFGYEMKSGTLDTLKEYCPKYDVETRFILEGKKIIFGAEYDSLYNLVVEAVNKNPKFNLSQELIDVRSVAIAENAKAISMRYKKKVAVVVGDNHLQWFSDHGFTVYHPPALR